MIFPWDLKFLFLFKGHTTFPHTQFYLKVGQEGRLKTIGLTAVRGLLFPCDIIVSAVVAGGHEN